MVTRSRGGNGESEKSKAGEEEGDKRGDYEKTRAQRIKENMERMKSLGIAELSHQLKRTSSVPPPPLRKPRAKPAPSHDPPRRSSRLQELPPVTYSEGRTPKIEDSSNTVEQRRKSLKKHRSKSHKKVQSPKEVEIHIPEGENPEIYTDEHEKLLGDSVAAWDLFVDGFDEDGHRTYDHFEGKNCHQCRQKTLGLRTNCSKCNTVTGQFCGDCLYMRYGENVKEANLNEDWVCPVCRGICNCSRCRRDKGWRPTGEIYKEVKELGFKSVAHYLIHTRREGGVVGLKATKSPSTGGARTDDDEKEGSSDALPQSGAREHEIAGVNVLDSDDEYEGDDHDEEHSDSDSAEETN